MEGILARTPGLLFMKSAMGFLMITESQDLGLTPYPNVLFEIIVSPSLYRGVRTHTDLLVSLTPLPTAT